MYQVIGRDLHHELIDVEYCDTREEAFAAEDRLFVSGAPIVTVHNNGKLIATRCARGPFKTCERR